MNTDREHSEQQTKQSRWGFRGMTVRNWLEILLVPLLLGMFATGLTAWFNVQQDARQNKIEEQRAEVERQIEEQRAQDAALQAYLDQMSTLLLEKDLRFSTDANATEESQEARALARSRTLTVLSRLDPRRKKEVMRFLIEAELVQGGPNTDLRATDDPQALEPVISLRGAHLHGVAIPTATLVGADLASTDLTDADLSGADLSYADLSGADVGQAEGISNEELALQAKSLKGATMPNGQKYEDWHKDREKRQQDE
jgi:cell division protein FtsB